MVALGLSMVGESDKKTESASGGAYNTTGLNKDIGKKAKTTPPDGTWGIK